MHAILLVAERSPLTGDVFNVAARESVSIDEVATTLSAAMGVQQPAFRHSGQQRAGDTRSWQADISRIEALG